MRRLFSVIILIIAAQIYTLKASENHYSINMWLSLGPLHCTAPCFIEAEDAAIKALEDEQLKKDNLRPAVERQVAWVDGNKYIWRSTQAGDGKLNFTYSADAGNSLNIVYTGFYIETKRRQSVEITLKHTFPAAVFFNGELQEKATTNGEMTTELDLHTGKHLLMVKTVNSGEDSARPWEIEAGVSARFPLEFSLDPQFTLAKYEDYALIDGVSSTTLSPDGGMVALVRSHRDREFKKHNWIEIYSVKSNRLKHSIEFNKSIGNPVFSSDGKSLYFRVSEKGGTCIWIHDLATGESKRVVGPISGLRKTRFSPDGKLVYYTADGERDKMGTDDYTMFTELSQKLTDWNDKRQIYVASLESGASCALSHTGNFAVDEIGLSPDGGKLVFTRRHTIDERPFFITEFWLIDLKKNISKMLLSQKIAFETRPLNLTILPGGEYMVYTRASHLSSAEDIEPLPNLSEVDLYLMNLKERTAVNLTGDTPFTVCEWGGTELALMWNPRDKMLYFPVLQRGYARIFMVNPYEPEEFHEVPVSPPFVGNVSLSANGKVLAYTGSSLNEPKSAYIFNLRKNREVKILNPNSELLGDIEMGKHESYDFTDSLGYLIDGWLFYPPDFDPAKKYPLICYYYAGMGPLDESFYYTYQFWTANGYVVYALTPVGAIAHGDEFSAFHVNDWGEYATRDIIEGVERLIADKDFIDSEKMGCYGGSYGGFTTMDLITKTDIFAAAISMYGISNIASYWGGGIWGYTYGDIALAQSFPWMSRDVFVEKSPLFHADKINTPLLLLHGEADVNVPSMESEQMFTALRVQGKDVAYVRFPGQNHGIAGNFKIYSTHREMMLEWWDKYLKGQPEGWNERWELEGE